MVGDGGSMRSTRVRVGGGGKTEKEGAPTFKWRQRESWLDGGRTRRWLVAPSETKELEADA